MTYEELKEYFDTASLPTETVFLTPAEKIRPENVQLFIESHLKQLKNYPDSRISEPFHDRLLKLKAIIESK